MKLRKVLTKLITFLIILGLCWGSLFVYKGYDLYREALEQKPLSQMVEEIQLDSNFLSLAEMPPIYIYAVIAIEDQRFYQHPGVDVVAIARAFLRDIQAGSFVEGGSTITQQIAKNQYFTQEKLLSRKVADAFMALCIERHYSKDEILELYVNTIFFGGAYYGVREASLGYFEKEPKELTDYESTLLAGIPNAPSAYALTKNPGLAHQRQERVLQLMVECEYLTLEQAETIRATGKG